MYKLTYFKATNVIGFMSGLGKKTFEIDLHKFIDKDIICIIGDNAKGKSTFLSLIHPWHFPTDNRPKFIIEGKEGTIIRQYENDTGDIMISHCVYHPKSDNGHSVKCFLKLIHSSNDEGTELNPNGNINSYYSLLYTYMGLSKDYINFASYNDSVAGIVKMTDTERKNNVNSLIPNTRRFDNAYDTVNSKYKELRNLIHNVSQKIIALRDKEALRSDLKHITSEINQYKENREEQVKQLAKDEERLSLLCNGKDVNLIINEYANLSSLESQTDNKLNNLKHKLSKLYDNLNLEYNDSKSITISNMIPQKIFKLEKRIIKSESTLQSYQEQIQSLSGRLKETEDSLMENQSVLYSIQAQDINELKNTKRNYEKQIEELRYTKMKNKFHKLSYDGAVSLSKVVAMADQMIQALYDEYGQLVTDYFNNHDKFDQSLITHSIEQLSITIETNNQKKDQIYRQLIEKEQYRKFQNIIDQRPKTCTIDSCPFIANALKWSKYASDIDQLKKEYDTLNITLKQDQDRSDDLQKSISIQADARKLVDYLKMNESLIHEYLQVTLEDVYKSIVQANWTQTLNILKVKEIAAILSEKELYIRIKTQMIPEIDHAIELATLYGSNRDILLHQIEKLEYTKTLLQKQLKNFKYRINIVGTMIDAYKISLSDWKELESVTDEYTNTITSWSDITNQITSYQKNIEQITSIQKNKSNTEQFIKEYDNLLSERYPEQERIRLNLHTLINLQEEKDKIETEFYTVNILRSILQPGKGIRKELLNIYMFDIYQIANKLLLETFNGNLYLKEFIISDKEFIIPYVYNGSEGTDISFASSSQQSTISIAISLAILSKVVDKYGIFTGDEIDAPLSKVNKEVFVDILANQMHYIGINQAFMITHSPDIYEQYDVGFIQFPGVILDGNKHDIMEII